MDEIVIALDDPTAPDVVALLETHLTFARGCTPAEDAHALDVEGLVDASIAFFGARAGGELLGVGALKTLDASHVEVKSMHTAAAARRRGVGRALLDHMLAVARERGCERVSLETGSMDEFAAARALYVAAGFVECEPFAEYVPSRNTTFMTLRLEAGDRGRPRG